MSHDLEDHIINWFDYQWNSRQTLHEESVLDEPNRRCRHVSSTLPSSTRTSTPSLKYQWNSRQTLHEESVLDELSTRCGQDTSISTKYYMSDKMRPNAARVAWSLCMCVCESVLDELPEKLKAEIAMNVHLNTLKRVAIFQVQCSPSTSKKLKVAHTRLPSLGFRS